MGDTNMCTDNPILLKRTLNSPTIMCVQRKAEKKIVEEADIIQANKLAFNDDIGIVTNHVTTMIEVQAGFEPGSKEYEILSYRIMCGQLYQQNTIDRAKGIIAKPMPDYWYNYRANMPNDNDSPEELERKEFNLRILAEKKPYFMIYVYPTLKAEYKQYLKSADSNAARKYCDTYGLCGIDDAYAHADEDDAVAQTVQFYERLMPVGMNKCVINRISWMFENEFSDFRSTGLKDCEFDYGILKCGRPYSRKIYNEIAKLYNSYRDKMIRVAQKFKTEKVEKYYCLLERKKLELGFGRECAMICTNEFELCDIVLDLCYQRENSKQFAWEMCGDVIVQNLLKNKMGEINYPQMVDQDGDFVYCGRNFVMNKLDILLDTERE